jgi:hypothetical protein
MNQFLNTNWVSMEVLRLLTNMLTVAEYFNRDYDKDFKQEFAVGSQITVKFPQRFLVVDGMGYQPQAINRIATTVNLDQWLQVPFEYDDYEKAVKLERSESELRENYYEPAAAALAQEIDSRAAKFAYQNANNVVGVLGTDPTGVATYYNARRRLKELAAPPGKRALCISSSMMSTFGQNITTFFQPADELSSMFKEGSLGRAAGFDWYESNSLYTHTAGTWAGAVTVNGANQSGTSLIITATAADTFKKGDKFSIANVNQVNPMTRRLPGPTQVKHFTITQDLTAAGGGADTINFLPAIYGPGSQYQNVDALPANAAALTLWPGTSSPNGKAGTAGLALTKSAFALVGAKLYLPKAVEDRGQASDKQTGLSIRFVKAWDPVRSLAIHRWDMLVGYGNLYQDNGAVCVVGA